MPRSIRQFYHGTLMSDSVCSLIEVRKFYDFQWNLDYIVHVRYVKQYKLKDEKVFVVIT
jgi:hypothetical protein